MGVHDLDARFDSIATEPGTVAAAAVASIRETARHINDQVEGEPYQLTIVLQALETAARQANMYLGFSPDDQPGRQAAAPAEVALEDMTVGQMRSRIAVLNENRGPDDQIPVSGTKQELAARIRDADSGDPEEDPPPAG